MTTEKQADNISVQVTEEVGQKQVGRRSLGGFLTFFGIFNLLLALLEYWIWKTYEMDLVAWPTLGRVFGGLICVGAASIPLAFVIAFQMKDGRTHILSWLGYIWLGTVNIFLIPTLLYNLFPNVIPGLWALSLSLMLAAVALVGGLLDPKVKRHRLKGFPALAGLRIVQLTDVHLGMLYLRKSWWSRQIARVNHLKPDIIAITGDLVEGSFDQVSNLVDMAKDLKASQRFFITGNHEYLHGGEIWSKKMRELGWTTLHNENKIVEYAGARLMVAGVPDRMVRRFGGVGESLPDLALSSSQPRVDCKILLAHEPASVLDCHKERPDFIFSGHTHAGQIWPFSIFVRIQQPMVSGWKKIRDVNVYASSGTGFWGPPMRLGTRSEISVFEFEK